MMSRSSRWGATKRVLAFALSSSLLGGCSDADATGPIAGEGPTGTIEVELTQVPTGVSCVKLTSSNGSIATLFNVAPGNWLATLAMGPLPVGLTTISASAYGALCGSVTSSTIPGWIGAPVAVDVTPATRPQVKLTLFPNESGAIDVTFHPRITGMSAGFSAVFAWTDPSIVPQTIYSWGSNLDGLLQMGSGVGLKPAATTLTNFSHVSVGSSHACGVIYSGLNQGNVMCWGSNTWGQLGDGTTTARPTPVMSWSGHGVTQVATGNQNSCLLMNGLAFCTGANNSGQLGNGTTTNSPTWVAVSGGSFSDITVGGSHVCGRANDGWRCWGNNTSGQLATGDTVSRSYPYSFVRAMVEVRAGMFHTCGRREDQTLWCWGANNYGQLGDGTTTDRLLPVQVTGLGAPVTSFGVGAYHTCARLSNGTVRCWGDNAVGQLGDGTGVNRTTPTPVANLSGALDVATTSYHACARLDTGTMRCWGYNYHGQLGNDTRLYAYAPSQVLF